MTGISDLPTELQTQILALHPWQYQHQLSKVCSLWQEITQDPFFVAKLAPRHAAFASIPYTIHIADVVYGTLTVNVTIGSSNVGATDPANSESISEPALLHRFLREVYYGLTFTPPGGRHHCSLHGHEVMGSGHEKRRNPGELVIRHNAPSNSLHGGQTDQHLAWNHWIDLEAGGPDVDALLPTGTFYDSYKDDPLLQSHTAQIEGVGVEYTFKKFNGSVSISSDIIRGCGKSSGFPSVGDFVTSMHHWVERQGLLCPDFLWQEREYITTFLKHAESSYTSLRDSAAN